MAATNSRTDESIRTQLLKLLAALDQDLSEWRCQWSDIEQYIAPGAARFNLDEHNRGKKRRQRIVNNTATIASRIFRAGMHSGITSPARPWFRLSSGDPGLDTNASVKRWLHVVGGNMRNLFLRSNLYNGLPGLYGDIGDFGLGAMGVQEDLEDGLRVFNFPVGSYRVATNGLGRVDTFIRPHLLTVRQIVERYGRRDERTGKADWSNISRTVRDQYERGNYHATYEVVHAIVPNPEFDPTRAAARFKRYASYHFERTHVEDDKVLLRHSGYDLFPILVPRWEVVGEDVHGSRYPGEIALGDAMSLQTLERRKAQAIEKMVRPPLMGPGTLRNAKVSTLPDDITYVDIREGMQGLRPIYEVNPRVQELMLDIQAHEQRINRAYFADLFLMLAMSDRRQITAREVSERHEEKLLMLGPVLERLNDELLDPLIDLAFHFMLNQDVDGNLVPPPPPELEGRELRVEYVSIMAQAQKLVGLTGLERFSSYVGNLAGARPDVLDKVDIDKAIDVYADITGVDPEIVRSDDEVAEIRLQRAQAEAAQAQMAQMQQAAQGAKLLSEADTGSDNALTRLLAGAGVPA